MLVNPISRQKLIAVKDPDTRVTLLLSRSKANMIKESYNVNVLTFNIFMLTMNEDHYQRMNNNSYIY
jgi:hypothetical protein